MLFKISIVLGVIIAMGFSMYRFVRCCTWIGELSAENRRNEAAQRASLQAKRGLLALGGSPAERLK